jgi:Helix-turn-helix domain
VWRPPYGDHVPIVATGSYINLDDAAARSGVSRSTLHQWCKRGRFPSAHKSLSDRDWSGEKWFILDRELEAVLGRRLKPDWLELEQELAAAEQLLADATASLEVHGEGQPIADLKFAAQMLAALRTQIAGEPLV